MLTNDTLGIDRDAQRRHELDLLATLEPRRPVPLVRVFGSIVPRWVREAAERALVRGELAGALDEVVGITDLGRATLAAK